MELPSNEEKEMPSNEEKKVNKASRELPLVMKLKKLNSSLSNLEVCVMLATIII